MQVLCYTRNYGTSVCSPKCVFRGECEMEHTKLIKKGKYTDKVEKTKKYI